MRFLLGIVLVLALLFTLVVNAFDMSTRYQELYEKDRETFERLIFYSHDLARHHRWLALRLLWSYKNYSDIISPFHLFPVLGNETSVCPWIRDIYL